MVYLLVWRVCPSVLRQNIGHGKKYNEEEMFEIIGRFFQLIFDAILGIFWEEGKEKFWKKMEEKRLRAVAEKQRGAKLGVAGAQRFGSKRRG